MSSFTSAAIIFLVVVIQSVACADVPDPWWTAEISDGDGGDGAIIVSTDASPSSGDRFVPSKGRPARAGRPPASSAGLPSDTVGTGTPEDRAPPEA